MLEEVPNIIVPTISYLEIFCGDELNVVSVGWFVLLLNYEGVHSYSFGHVDHGGQGSERIN